MACSALQRSQEEASQKVDQEVARLQVPGRVGRQLGYQREGLSGGNTHTPSPACVLPLTGSSLSPAIFLVPST